MMLNLGTLAIIKIKKKIKERMHNTKFF